MRTELVSARTVLRMVGRTFAHFSGHVCCLERTLHHSPGAVSVGGIVGISVPTVPELRVVKPLHRRGHSELVPGPGNQIREQPTQADVGSASRPIVASLAWDIALNATIPAACYWFSKRFVSPSEMTALIVATGFPVFKSAYDVARHGEIDPVAVIVLLGIGTGILALSVGGDSRMLLIRESFFTGAFGIACLISLTFPRPIMFYFGRHFIAGKDPQKLATFDARWQDPRARRAHRLVTVVWGLVYVGEFIARVLLVYRAPASVVLVVSPFLTGVATILVVMWTFWYAFRVRSQIRR
jgi:hypothetical protein